MADINKITKTKLKATEKNTSPTVDLEPGEIKAITKSRLISNVSGGGSGGESVSPTLNLIDFETHTVRTTITEQEKINIEKGLYNQVIYTDFSNKNAFEMFTPSKLFYIDETAMFANFDSVNIVADTPSFSSISVYRIDIYEKDTNGEYPITIEEQFSINLGSDGGGGESVSPTLNLMDLGEGTVRTTITEQEKLNLDKGLYNQVYYFRSNQGLDGLSIYMPSKLFSLFGSYLFSIMIAADENNPVVNNLEFYMLKIGEKNADGEYPITIESGADSGLPDVSFGTGGGSSEIPTLSTIAPSMSDLTTTVYSDDDIALIKKQKDNFIKVPFGTAENNTSELCYVSYGTKYSLIDIAGTILSFANSLASSPNFLYFDLDETTKKLIGKSYSSLSTSETSLYVESSTNKIFLTDQLTLSSPTQVLNKAYYFDKINGKSIIHEENTINNYDLGKSINLFGNHSILVPNSSSDTEINLYNHFIKITGNASEVESGANIIARFTIQSSNNLVVDTPEKLTTLLGNEFELGCNGIYGNYNITGLKKTADGALNIIYNNGGTESLLNTTGITLTIGDTVKTI